MPLRVTLAFILLLVAVLFTTPDLGAATRHWVAAAQPPAACTMGGQP